MIKELIQSICSLECFYKPRLWLAIGFSIISSAIVLPVGILIQLIFDKALPLADFTLLLILGSSAIGLIIINGFLTVAARNSILKITRQEILKIRNTLTDQLLRASHHFHLQSDHSKIHKTAVYDTEKIDGFLNALFSILIPSVIVSTLLTGVLIFLDWQMSLVLVALGSVGSGAIYLLRKNRKDSLIEFQKMFEVFHSHILFVLEFHKLIKASSSQQAELTRNKKIAEQLNESSEKMVEGYTRSASYQELVFSTASMILLMLGGYRVMQGALTIGTLVSFYFCLYLLKKYFISISNVAHIIVEGNYALKQYHHVVDSMQPEPYTGTKTFIFTGTIIIDQLSFSFASKNLFENFSMHLRPGAVTLLNGPNGSGKSTLIHLLLGFYKPDQGNIIADHIFYHELDLTAFRNQVSVLFQENLVFNGTIIENIQYGYAQASDEDLDNAIRSASLNEYIASLPNGKHAQVGDKGMKLSGGQRQKIGLARCFLSKAPLIIMDEPTNHLDQQTIKHFINCIKNMRHQPAVLLVSHDEVLSSIADQVYQLKNH